MLAVVGMQGLLVYVHRSHVYVVHQYVVCGELRFLTFCGGKHQFLQNVDLFFGFFVVVVTLGSVLCGSKCTNNRHN